MIWELLKDSEESLLQSLTFMPMRMSFRALLCTPSLVFYRVLAEVEGILEPVGLQEETELPARIMEEFVRVCIKVGPSISVEAGPRIAY